MIRLPRDMIRRHHAETRPHRVANAAPPPVAMPGDPTADIPRWDLEAGREGLTSILQDAQRRSGR